MVAGQRLPTGHATKTGGQACAVQPTHALYLQDDLEKLRTAYDRFLAEFPLCYGYWKKYAEAERRHGNLEGTVAVLERGLVAVPYSVDLWVHYAAFQQSRGAAAEDVRRWG